jgi:YidC/Oxa1 family membrane protein insertase
MNDGNKRQIITIAIVGVASIAMWWAFSRNDEPDRPAQQQEQGAGQGGAQAKKGAIGKAPVKSTPRLSVAERERQRVRQQRLATIETRDMEVVLTNLNGGVRHVKLKGSRYQRQGRPMDVVTTDKEPFLPFYVELGGVEIPDDAVWAMEQLSPTEVRFTWRGDGFLVVRKVEAGRGPYQLWSTVSVTNESEGPRPVRVTHVTHHYVKRADESGGFFASASQATSFGVCAYGDGEIERINRDDLLEQAMGFGQNVRFAGIESTYFANVMAPSGAGAAGRAERCRMRASDRGNPDEPDGSLFESRLLLPRAMLAPNETKTFRVLGYLGPKVPEALAAAGHGLPEVVDLGFFSLIARPLVELLSWIQRQVGNWGLAIILLTIVIKVLLFPLTYKSFQSMARLRFLKPEIDRINALYPDDREKKAAATMELYRKQKINPFGGCLPQLLQLPIWWALYTSLSTNVELYNMPFVGWYHDLSSPDPYYVLPLALGLLMYVQQRITPSTMDPMQAKMMLYMMPVMITLFMLFLPAGLCVYMLTNSALGIGQQKLIEAQLRRTQSAAATTAAAAAATAATAGKDEQATDGDDDADDAIASSSSSRPKPRPGKGGRRKGRGRA